LAGESGSAIGDCESGHFADVWAESAISPGELPARRTVTDQTTYYLTNRTSASSTTKGTWKQEYTFTRQWMAQT